MKTLVLAAALAASAGPSWAAAKGTRFWNLTANTIADLRLAPAGTNAWGPNQCLNDADKSVDHDERLKILGTASGTYDVKLSDRTGRTCVVRNIAVRDGAVFSIEEKQLSDCTMK